MSCRNRRSRLASLSHPSLLPRNDAFPSAFCTLRTKQMQLHCDRLSRLFAPAILAVACVASVGSTCAADDSYSRSVLALDVFPKQVDLSGPGTSAQLVVTGRQNDGKLSDVTAIVEYRIANSDVLSVSPNGRVTPKSDGTTDVQIRSGNVTRTVSVRVSGMASSQKVSFEHETLPALAKAGCSGGACHGSPHGKGEFRLSLFGFEPAFDRASLVRESQSRRVNTINPAESLLLRKPTMQIPHAGGRRLKQGDALYSLLHNWIRGMPCRSAGSCLPGHRCLPVGQSCSSLSCQHSAVQRPRSICQWLGSRRNLLIAVFTF